jgi:hypothetical protein
MSTPTPTITSTPINDTGINNIFSFIGTSSTNIQLLIVAGIIITVFISIVYLMHRRK